MDRLSILIVDDNASDRYLLKRHLEGLGFPVKFFETEDGVEALEFFKNYEKNRELYPKDYPPMIVFLDINMPRMNGFAFLEEFSKLRNRD